MTAERQIDQHKYWGLVPSPNRDFLIFRNNNDTPQPAPVSLDTLEPLADLASQLTGLSTLGFHPTGGILVADHRGGERRTRVVTSTTNTGAKYELEVQEFGERMLVAEDGVSMFDGESSIDWKTGRPMHSPLRGDLRYPQIDADMRYVINQNGLWRLPRFPSMPPPPTHEQHHLDVRYWWPRSQGLAVAFNSDGAISLHRPDVREQPRLTAARLRDTKTGAPIGRPLRQRGDSQWDHALSRDGRLAATSVVADPDLWAFNSGEVYIYDATTGQRRFGPLRPNNSVAALEFSPDGSTLVTGGFDRMLRFYDTGTGEEVGEPILNEEIPITLVFSPDGQRLAVGSSHGFNDSPHFRIFDVQQRKSLHTDQIPTAGSWGQFAVFTEDGKRIIVGSPRGISACDPETGNEIYSIAATTPDAISNLVISPNNQIAALVEATGLVRAFSVADGSLVCPPMMYAGHPMPAAFSADSSMLAVGYIDSTIRLWDLKTGHAVGPPYAHRNPVWGVAFAPDGEELISTDSTGIVRRWPIPKPVDGGGDELLEQLEVWSQTELVDGIQTALSRTEWQARNDRVKGSREISFQSERLPRCCGGSPVPRIPRDRCRAGWKLVRCALAPAQNRCAGSRGRAGRNILVP